MYDHQNEKWKTKRYIQTALSQVPIGQAGKICMNTKMFNERPGGTIRLYSAEFSLAKLEKLYDHQNV